MLVGLAVAVAAALTASACSGGDDEPAVTLPSSLVAPTTTPDAAAPTSTTTTTTAPVTPDGSPRITGVGIELASSTCAGSTVGATVTVGLEAEPPVRVVTVFLDGSTTALANGNPQPAGITLEVPALPCDGATHTVLVIATGERAGDERARSTTSYVTVRTPVAAPAPTS